MKTETWAMAMFTIFVFSIVFCAIGIWGGDWEVALKGVMTLALIGAVITAYKIITK